MKKILFISMYFYPEIGSSDYYINDLKAHLSKNGFEISTVAPNPVRDLSKEEIELFRKKEYERFNDMDVFRLYCGSNNSNGLLNRISRINRYKRQLKNFIKKNHSQYDVIYIPSNPPVFIPLMIERLCKKYGIRSIYSITDIWPQITGKYNFLKPFSKKAMLKADTIVTLSEDMKNTICDICGREDIEIIRIWPHDSIFDNNKLGAFKLDKNKFNIFYIGNIGAFQNIDLLLDTAKVCANNERFAFYFVGSGRNKTHLIKRIEKEHINNVNYISRVDNSEASILYKQADLNIISLGKNKIFYACPSKTSTCLFANKECLLLMDHSKYSDELLTNKNFVINDSFDANDTLKTIISIADGKLSRSLESDEKLRDLYSKANNLNKWLDVFKG